MFPPSLVTNSPVAQTLYPEVPRLVLATTHDFLLIRRQSLQASAFSEACSSRCVPLALSTIMHGAERAPLPESPVPPVVGGALLPQDCFHSPSFPSCPKHSSSCSPFGLMGFLREETELWGIAFPLKKLFSFTFRQGCFFWGKSYFLPLSVPQCLHRHTPDTGGAL